MADSFVRARELAARLIEEKVADPFADVDAVRDLNADARARVIAVLVTYAAVISEEFNIDVRSVIGRIHPVPTVNVPDRLEEMFQLSEGEPKQ